MKRIDSYTDQIICGDCIEVMKGMPDESVQCVITSPPYFGLRSYETPDLIWDGEKDCEHDFSIFTNPRRNRWQSEIEGHPKQMSNKGCITEAKQGAFCLHCGAWRGSFGLEPTMQLYIDHTVQIFREVRRVLRKDGTLWLNLGDSYIGGGNNRGNNSPISVKQASNAGATGQCSNHAKNLSPANTGLPPKNLCGIPWRAALALQADGWILRSDTIEEVELYCPCGCGHVMEERIWRYSQDRDIIWAKPNPMPESVKDRPTKSHEYLFLLTKSGKYYYDADAISEPSIDKESFTGRRKRSPDMRETGLAPQHPENNTGKRYPKRNKRSVWTIPTMGYKDAHFATFPPDLVKPCVLAGSKPGDVILDPFGGSGTVAMVAAEYQRKYISIELNPEYIGMQKDRTNTVHPKLGLEE